MRQALPRSKHEVRVVREVSEVRTKEPASLGRGGKPVLDRTVLDRTVLDRTVLLAWICREKNIELFEGANPVKLLSSFNVL
jgi:hypothetical protein